MLCSITIIPRSINIVRAPIKLLKSYDEIILEGFASYVKASEGIRFLTGDSEWR